MSEKNDAPENRTTLAGLLVGVLKKSKELLNTKRKEALALGDKDEARKLSRKIARIDRDLKAYEIRREA